MKESPIYLPVCETDRLSIWSKSEPLRKLVAFRMQTASEEEIKNLLTNRYAYLTQEPIKVSIKGTKSKKARKPAVRKKKVILTEKQTEDFLNFLGEL